MLLALRLALRLALALAARLQLCLRRRRWMPLVASVAALRACLTTL
jgi:hypothetical protein